MKHFIIVKTLKSTLIMCISMIIFCVSPAFGQGFTVTGTVYDDSGDVLPGASVVVMGTTFGTITDINGQYTLNPVTAESILQFSFVGFISQEIAVGSNRIIDATLQEDALGLDELVVIGYGVQRRANLTGSVSTVNFDEETLNRPITDASQALSGRVSGLWVSQNSGQPGSDEATILVRGYGTLNNAAPLVIIDGVQGQLSAVNPNDIESITVLKDAASAAIYGSRAANGVILITTKTGNRNERTEVTFSTSAGLQTIGMKYDLINNSAESMRIHNQAYANDGRAVPLYPESLISRFEAGGDEFKYPNTDWFSLMYKPSMMYDANFSVRGGTQRSSSFLSFNYQNQDGLVPNTSSYRYGMRANLDYEINSWLNIGGRLNYMRRISDEPFDLARTFEIIRGSTPFVAPYDRLGRWGSSEAIDDAGVQIYDNRNPLIDANNGNRRRTDNNLTADAIIRITFTKDLVLNTTWSSTGRWVLVDQYNTPGYGYTDSGMETITKNYNREGLMMIRNFGTISFNNNVYSTLNYNKRFEVHDISAVAGIQIEDFNNKNVMAQRTEPALPGLTQVNAGTSGIQGEGTMVGYRMFSYFGRINYALAHKYLFEINFRADASSRFMEGNRWGYFPGLSAGWRLSEEEFMQNLGIFSNLKLRASWGQLGNQNIASYWPYLEEFSQNFVSSYSYGGNLQPGAAITAMTDPNITWETTTTTGFGIDMGLMNNRLNFELDYFNKITKDILVQLPIPILLGGRTAAFENVGEMLNRGFEFSVNYDKRVANSDQLGYNLGFNFTYVHNEVTKFREDAPDQLRLIREGYSFRTLYGYNVTGIYQTDEEAAAHMHSNSFVPKAGNLKIEDLNGDGRLDFQDMQEMGNSIPKITYGLTARLNYKNFDLSMLFQGLGLSHLYSNNVYERVDLENQSLITRWRDAWTPENTDTRVPAVRMNSSWDMSANSFWVYRQDFLKMRNIQLGYLLPRELSSRIGMNRAYVYANIQNVFTLMMFKGYDGFDPERGFQSGGGDTYPVPRVYSLGFNLTF